MLPGLLSQIEQWPLGLKDGSAFVIRISSLVAKSKDINKDPRDLLEQMVVIRSHSFYIIFLSISSLNFNSKN